MGGLDRDPLVDQVRLGERGGLGSPAADGVAGLLGLGGIDTEHSDAQPTANVDGVPVDDPEHDSGGVGRRG